MDMRAARPAGTLQPVVTADFTVNQGRQAAERLIAAPRHPTAVSSANDLLALGVMQTAFQSGLRIPDGLALVGYYDIVAAQTAGIPLTSVRVDGHTAGLLLDEPAIGGPWLGSAGAGGRPRSRPGVLCRCSSVAVVSALARIRVVVRYPNDSVVTASFPRDAAGSSILSPAERGSRPGCV
ncbi:substrate-binding domain-containing protein [Streptomyces sp. NBC_00365]|uniref:substrate-binding domain-containing protein n=1 Tax=Streptomyces sp. NBC_00365 TaxID=2975726 RepID=UPI00224CDB93|nr:substrate-binding domain-containing protein [Streptomyces sp. NBC_00365]MCX5096870.1 substrate-binding domain-containing protein [Streptomyces sp. NBC_00365]